MSHLWSGRFSSEPDAEVFDHGRSFAFDRRLFEDDVTGSLAWVEALKGAGVLSMSDAGTIEEGLRAIRADVLAAPNLLDGPDEDVHAFVERLLVERVGDVGKRLHTGRSRNEQVSLDLRLYLRRRIPLLQGSIVGLVGALADQASRAGDALMPSYTHLRRAQPVLVAHFFLAHTAALRRDHRHLAFAGEVADDMPLGSGAVSGTSYPVDADALAHRLGFSRVAANSIDASSDRDFVAAFLHAASLSMVHLSRLAEDLVLFTGEEFGFFSMDDGVSTGSSLMPQKKNPDPLELVRGKTGRVIGRLTGWLTTVKGLPGGYNKDLQEDKEAVFDAEDTLAGALAVTTRVVQALELQPARARAAAGGLSLATEVADYLVRKGLPFRDAHEVVGAMVQRLLATGRGFEGLSEAEWRSASPLFESDVVAVVSPQAAVAARRTPQSTAPTEVAKALAETQAWVRTSAGLHSIQRRV